MQLLIREYDAESGSCVRTHGPFEARAGAVIALGRDVANQIILSDRSVSRFHARLSCDGSSWRIQDLDSRFGTRLNDHELREAASIRSGDRVLLGRLPLELLAFAAAPEEHSRPAASVAGAPEAPAAPAPGARELERRYAILIDILELLAGERSLDDLLSAVIRLAGRAVEADRGFILLYDAEAGNWLPDSVAPWQASGENAVAFEGDLLAQVSKTVLGEALSSGRTVFLKFAATDPRYEEAESIHLQEVQSLICCPLLVGERRVGAFYVDRKHEGGRPFTEADGELLEVVAQQAARVLEKEQLLDEKNRAEKLALLGIMVGRITHELKNPLYNIRGTTENLIDKLSQGPLPESDLAQRLERILAGCEKAEGRMRRLLRFARPAAKARERVSLARVLTAAAAETADRLAAAGVTLERRYAKGAYVLADAEALEQVFVNLIVNAVQAMAERGSGRIILELSLEQRLSESKPDWVEVRVSDDGPGIPPEHLSQIFEDFFTTKAAHGGSGLGLALCRHLVAEQRGRLSAENRPEGGALFRVGLPLLDWSGPDAPA